MLVEDGKGTGLKAKVDTSYRLHVQSVAETEGLHAVVLGDAFNINTGNVTFSAAGTLLYIQNNEDRDLVIEAIAVGAGQATVSDIGEMTIVRNPTGGDLITDATAVDMNQNRDFGSSKTLSAFAYKGKSAGTLTGGEDTLLVYIGANNRSLISLNLQIPKGTSIGITLDPKLSSGTMKAYCAAVCYLKPDSAED